MVHIGYLLYLIGMFWRVLGSNMPAVEREIGSARKYTKAVYPTFREYASVDFIGLFWFTSDTWYFLLECFDVCSDPI